MVHHLCVALLWLVLWMVVGPSMLQELGAVRSRLRHVSATLGAAPTAPGTISRPATVDEPDVEPGHCLSTNPVRSVLGGGSISKGYAELCAIWWDDASPKHPSVRDFIRLSPDLSTINGTYPALLQTYFP